MSPRRGTSRPGAAVATATGLTSIAIGVAILCARWLVEIPPESVIPDVRAGPGAGLVLCGSALLMLARELRVAAALTGLAAPLVGAIQPSGTLAAHGATLGTGGILDPRTMNASADGPALAVTVATVSLLLSGAGIALLAKRLRTRAVSLVGGGLGALTCAVATSDILVRFGEMPWAELVATSTWLTAAPDLGCVALGGGVLALSRPERHARRSNGDRRRVVRLALILATVVTIVAGLAIVSLYSVAFDRERRRVQEYARHAAAEIARQLPHADPAAGAPGIEVLTSRARMVARHLGGELQAAALGDSSEVLVGRRAGEDLEFLARWGTGGSGPPSRLRTKDGLAEPMQRAAFFGESGTIVGVDYRGRDVLAGYTALETVGLGIVVKRDLSEFRAPFVRAGLFAVSCAILLTIVGTTLFVRIAMPLVRNLEESERQHLLAQEIGRLGHWRWAVRDGVISGSPQFFQLVFGSSRRRDVSMRELVEVVHPEDRALLLDAARSPLKGGGRFELEVRACHQGDDERILSVQGRAEPRATPGRATHVVGTVLDVTARARAEHDLREAGENLEEYVRERTKALVTTYDRLRLTQFAIDNAADPIFWIDEDGRFIYVNAAACDSLGYSSEELLAMSVPDIDPRLPADAWPTHWDELRQTGSMTFESEHRTKNRGVIPVEITASYQDFEGTAFNFARARDISKRKEAWEAFASSERRYRRFIETSPYAIAFSTPEGKLVDANPAARELFGLGEDDDLRDVEIARDLYERPEDRERVLEQLREHDRVEDLEVGLKTLSGAILLARLTESVERDRDGQVIGIRCIIRDVTQRRNLEEQLRQSQKMDAIGTFAGGVAHDFNNMLVAILGYADLALDSLDGNSQLAADIAEIKVAGERAAKLTRQLLAFSRRQEMEPSVLDINEIVGGLTSLLRTTLGESVQLATELDPELGRVRADPAQVEQVLMETAVNARDAMPDGGTVTIRTANAAADGSDGTRRESAPHGGLVVLEISDTGVGMDAATLERVFEPFYTTKEVELGTGLGLSTVYGIVKQSGGDIRISSGPGHGTTIRILLKQVDGEEIPESKPVCRSAGESAGESILLVEDDDGVRGLTARCLADGGFEVLQASDGEEALRILEVRGRAIDLLLTDVVMPGISGPDVAEAVLQRWPGTRVLFVSGYPRRDAHAIGPKAISGEFLRKPYTPVELSFKIREMLDDRWVA